MSYEEYKEYDNAGPNTKTTDCSNNSWIFSEFLIFLRFNLRIRSSNCLIWMKSQKRDLGINNIDPYIAQPTM